MALMRRRVALVFLAVAAVRAFAVEYPTKPVRIIAPFSAGGSVDLVARLLEIDLGSRLDSRSSSTIGAGVGQYRHRAY
jgi:tripartite-type tricarboxylate transporter receptor subunit TctC